MDALRVTPSAPRPPGEREDARLKVTGTAVYTTDLGPPGCLHAAIARSTVAHGLLRHVDVSRARAHPDVVGVLVGADLAHLDPRFGEWVLDQTPLAIGRVRFHGEPIAAVVARSPRTARAAAALVEADVEPLPTALDIAAATTSQAIPIHPAGEHGANICYEFGFEVGDVETALASAAWVHRATYEFPAVYHYAMEPFACIAEWSDGELTVWSGTQEPFRIRADLARIFRLPLSRVRVRVPFVGGGYGSKAAPKYEPLTAALAIATGRPVKLVVDVREAFLTVSRHAARIIMTTGVDANGNLIARDTRIDFDTGAYADKGPRVARKGAYRSAGPYRISNVRSHARAVYTNKLPAGAFRGFSTPQVVWASESAMDEIAAHLGEDPVAYRRRHLRRRGEPFLADDAPLDADLVQGLEIAAEQIGWGGPPASGMGRGRGVAVAVKDGGGGPGRSEAIARLHLDGSVELLAATVELGQGARTVLRGIAAEVLGVPPDSVRVSHVDTDVVPFDVGTGASRSTIAVGSAAADACRRLRERLGDLATAALGAFDELLLDGADVEVIEGGNRRRCSLSDLLSSPGGLPAKDLGPLTATGVHETAPGASLLGSTAPFYEVAHGAADVQVDVDTGEVRVLRYISVPDVGAALNRVSCEGQDEGGAVMGLGHTLYEALEHDAEGQLMNGALYEYRVPRPGDLPAEGLHTVLLENGDGPGPHGSKGAGEGGIIPVAPAIANAVARATGVRIRRLPLTPEAVWRALLARPGSGEGGASPTVEDQGAPVQE